MRAGVGRRLGRHFGCAYFDRRGHGRSADGPGPFDYDEMAEQAILVLEYLGGPMHLVGHSDGGVIALKAAMRRPDLVQRVVAVGANLHHDALVGVEPIPTQGPGFDEWCARYASVSPDDPAHARVIIEKSNELVFTQPTMSPADLSALNSPVLIVSGDDDVVALEHSVAMFHALPAGEFFVVPGASHGLLKERPGLVGGVIRDFLTEPFPRETRMPIRRRDAVAS